MTSKNAWLPNPPPPNHKDRPGDDLPILAQIRRDDGVTGARARKSAQRQKDSNPSRPREVSVPERPASEE